MKNLFLLNIVLLICFYLFCAGTNAPGQIHTNNKSNAINSGDQETTNSYSGIWFETSFSPKGQTFKSYHAILQLPSSGLKVTDILNKNDALEGKVREVLFQDSKNNHNLYIGFIMNKDDVSFYRIKDNGTSKAVFMNYELQKKDNNTLTGTWSFLPKNGIGKSVVKVKWERLKDSFELINESGETIRTIK